jgi:hypothetical protein
MRQAVSSILFGLAGFGISIVMERYVTALPEWAWRIVGLASLAVGIAAACLTDSGLVFLRSQRQATLYLLFGCLFAAFGLLIYGLIAYPLLMNSSSQGELALSLTVGELQSTLLSQRNQLFVRAHLELTNTGPEAISAEVWMEAVPTGRDAIFIPAMPVRNPLIPPDLVIVPGGFLGHVVNIPAHSTVEGQVAFMVLETELKSVFGVNDMREFCRDLQLSLECRDRLSGRKKSSAQIGGGRPSSGA